MQQTVVQLNVPCPVQRTKQIYVKETKIGRNKEKNERPRKNNRIKVQTTEVRNVNLFDAKRTRRLQQLQLFARSVLLYNY
jgi:hypothetical protein